MQNLQLHSLDGVSLWDRNFHVKEENHQVISMVVSIWDLKWNFQLHYYMGSRDLKLEYKDWWSMLWAQWKFPVKVEGGKLRSRWRQDGITWNQHQRWIVLCSHTTRQLVRDNPLKEGHKENFDVFSPQQKNLVCLKSLK